MLYVKRKYFFINIWETQLQKVFTISVSLFFFSEEQAKLAARKYARIVQKLGFTVCWYSVTRCHKVQSTIFIAFHIWV